MVNSEFLRGTPGKGAATMRRWIAISLVAAFYAVVTNPSALSAADGSAAASEVRSEAPRSAPVPGAERAAAADERAFAWELFARLAKADNLVFSPYSISSAAAMVSAGAAGETLGQIRRALHFTEEGDAFHAGQNALALAMEARNQPATWQGGPLTLRSSNGLWLLPALRPPAALLDTLATCYGTGVRLAAFDIKSGEVRAAINAQVSSDTNGLIPELFPAGAIDRDTVFALSNALYFKGTWSHPFKEAETQEELFHALNGASGKVPMMRQIDTFSYAAGPGYQSVGLSYRGDIEMLLVVPDAGHFEEVRARFDPRFVAELVAQRHPRLVRLGLPRFTVRSNVPLADALREAGMVDAFDKNRADFSGIADGVFLGAAVHQAVVIVDEKGTEAAAATGFAVEVTSVPPQDPVDLTVDRPFLFAIRDFPTGCVLFAGQVVTL